MDSVVCLATLEELRIHVREILCSRDHLDLDSTPFHQAIIRRAGRACGLFFQVDGPRQVRNTAVWASEESRILYYDSSGIRFAESRLSEAPDPRKLEKAAA